MLDLAARLAWRGLGRVEPNPMVGCVLVRAGVVIGMGHHARFGDLHAERAALADAARRGQDPRGATAYVTLEPCGHRGKQPPCTDALIEAGVRRVVYARADPGAASGGGAEILRAAGLGAAASAASAAAVLVGDPFVRRVRTGRPFVVAKWAQTAEGRIASRPGAPRWISNELSRARVHRLRGRVDAVLTGVGTARADDPMLDCRTGRPARRVARRVVIDTRLTIGLDTRLVASAGSIETVVVPGIVDQARAEALRARAVRIAPAMPGEAGGVDLDAALRWLGGELGAATVLVEAGPRMLASLFAGGLVDAALVYTTPADAGDRTGGRAAAARACPDLADAARYPLLRAKQLREDVEALYWHAGGDTRLALRDRA